MAKSLTPWLLLAISSALHMGTARPGLPALGGASSVAQLKVVDLPESHWMRLKSGSIEFDFDHEGGAFSLYDVVVGCGEFTDLMFRFGFEVERYLQQTTVRLTGQKSIPRDRLQGFVQVLFLISDVGVADIGSDEFPILELSMIESLRVPFSEEGQRALSLQATPDAYKAYFPADTQQWNLSFLDVLRDLADVTGVQIAWSAETEKLLSLSRPRLLGERAVAKDQLVPYLQALASLVGCGAEVIGNDEVSAVVIKPL